MNGGFYCWFELALYFKLPDLNKLLIIMMICIEILSWKVMGFKPKEKDEFK